ncbi:MAG TPA: hypothetical protein VJH92_04740 [Candidatus Nanoarchaeia archaeon]|nr:hypothetical protein [Candidatus Nanoarchaeia archaeon]
MGFKEDFKNLPRGIKIISIVYYIATLMYLSIAILSLAFKETLKKLPEFSSISLPLNQAAAIIGIFFLILSIFVFFTATSLIKRRNWARIALIIFSSANGIMAITSVYRGNPLSLINLAFNLTIASYLVFSKRIKSFFKK